MALVVRAVPGSSLPAFVIQVAAGAAAYGLAALALNVIDLRSRALSFVLRWTRGVRSA